MRNWRVLTAIALIVHIGCETLQAQTPPAVAGTGTAGFLGDGLSQDRAQFNKPEGVAFDAAGNLLVADTLNNRVRRIDQATAVVTTIAGQGGAAFFGDGGQARDAYLNGPTRLAVDAAGNIYFSDAGNHRVRRITPQGIISTVAGNGVAAGSGDGMQATSASLDRPAGLAVGPGGTLYIADTGTGTIRFVDAGGIISTVAGGGGASIPTDGSTVIATSVRISEPQGLALLANGELLIAAAGTRNISGAPFHSLLRLSGTGLNSVVSTQRLPDFCCGGTDVTTDTAGAVYFTRLQQSQVQLVRLSSDFSTGTTLAAGGAILEGVAVSSTGLVFAADLTSSQIRRVQPAGPLPDLVVTAATAPGFVRQATVASLEATVANTGPAASAATIVRFWFSSSSSTPQDLSLAGEVAIGSLAPGQSLPITAPLTAPLELKPGDTVFTFAEVDPANLQAEASDGNNRFLSVDPVLVRAATPGMEGPLLTRIAGNADPSGGFGGDTLGARRAALAIPRGLTVDLAGNVLFCDGGNDRVRKLDRRTNIITTVAGDGFPRFSGDGGAATAASLKDPHGLAIDTAGNLYISDTGNHRIRKVDPSGIITTVAGTDTAGYDGERLPGPQSSLNGPEGIAVDANGDLLIADRKNNRVRKLERATGLLNTVVGPAPAPFATISDPEALALDRQGRLLIVGSGSCSGCGGIYRIDRVAGVRELRANLASRTNAIAVGADGTYYASWNGAFDSQIEAIDPDTLNRTIVASNGLTLPDGSQARFSLPDTVTSVVVAPDGDLLVSLGRAFGNLDFGRIVRISLAPARANLSISQVTAPPSSRAGNLVQVTASITNSGTATAASADVAFFIGSDITPTFNMHQLLAEVPGEPLGPGQSRVVSRRVRLPFQFNTPASYFVTARADPQNRVTESIETDNTAAAPALFLDHPDTAGAVTPLEVVAGVGRNGVSSPDGTMATSATLENPRGVAIDPQGNIVFIASFFTATSVRYQQIRRIDRATGRLQTIGGSAAGEGFSGDGGPAVEAQLNKPTRLVYDRSGNLFVSDTDNHRVRRITPSGRIDTVAGTGTKGFNGDTAQAGTSAHLNTPFGLAVDAAGNLYIADSGNSRVRILTPGGVLSSLAGPGGPLNRSVLAALPLGDGAILCSITNSSLVEAFDPVSGATRQTVRNLGNHRFLPALPAVQAGMRSNQALSLGLDASGALVITDDRGIYRLDAITQTMQLLAGADDRSQSNRDPRGEATALGVFADDIAVDAANNLVFTDARGFGAGRIFKLRIQPASPSGGPAEPPSVQSISPSTVLNGAPARLTLLGAGFGGLSSVRLDDPGSTGLSDLQLVNDSLLFATLPAGVAPGSYSVLVSAAGGTSTSDAVRLTVVSRDSRPDVGVSRVTASAPEVAQGQPLRLGATIGNSSASGAGGFAVLFSLAPVNGGSAIPVASVPVVSIAAGTTSPVEAAFDVPATVPAGLYVVKVDLDPDDFLGDPNRLDNSIRSTVTVAVTAAGASPTPPPRAIAKLLGANGAGPQVLDLDATPSSDRPGASLVYSWQLVTRPSGAAAFSSALPAVQYAAQVPGQYVFQLTVTNPASGLSARAVAGIRIGASPPRASAGPDLSIILPDPTGAIGSSFTTTTLVLDGSLSRDPAGGELSYSWRLLASPSSGTFDPPTGLQGASTAVAQLRFGVDHRDDGRYAQAGVYRLLLEVTNPLGVSSADEVLVTVLDPALLLPIADAGLDRAVAVRILGRSPLALERTIPDPTVSPVVLTDEVRLDGRGSRDGASVPKLLTYRWRVVQAPARSAVIDASLQGARTPTPAFSPDRAGLYRFSLVVDNGLFESAPSFVNVFVTIERDAVDLAGLDRPPFAVAFARDQSGLRRSEPGTAPLTFVAGLDRVFLDGSLAGSFDYSISLGFLWTQLDGPPVDLAPSATSQVVSFVPRAPGFYRFQLVVTDPQGASSAPAIVEIAAVSPGRVPTTLAIRATATGTNAVGFDSVDTDPVSRSLRAAVPTTVTLEATVSEEAPPDSRRLSFAWLQVGGPPVPLLVAPAAAGSSNVSVARFTPLTSGLYAFALSVQRTDGTSQVAILSKRVRVAVDAGGIGVPVARAEAFVGQAKDGSPCQVVTLDGDASAGVGAGLLSYRWIQVEGPPVTLSNPFSAITSFVTPDFGDEQSRTYLFQLVVESPAGRSVPAPVSLTIAGTGSSQATLDLLPRWNLIGLPLDPGTTARAADASDLAALTGASFVVRFAAPEGVERSRFEVYLPGGLTPPFPLAGNEGYLVYRPPGSPALTMLLNGRRWGTRFVERRLAKGAAFVHYPRGVPEGATSATLLREMSATHAIRVVQGDGGGRFAVYVDGFSTPFALVSGQATLLGLRSARTVRLAGREESCR